MKQIAQRVVTSSGIYFRGLLTVPDQDTQKIIIHVHGMAGSYLDHNLYPEMQKYYSEMGVAFITVENRGTGAISEFETNHGKIKLGAAMENIEDCVEDIQAWVDHVQELGYSEIWLQSHSLGTIKTAYYMSQVMPKYIAGLIFLSPSEMIGLVHDREGQVDFDVMYPEAKKLILDGKPEQILSHKLWGEQLLSARTFVNLFADESRAAIFNYVNPELGWEVVERISVPVLAITGTDDDGILPVIEPSLAMKMLEKELVNSPRVKTIVYDGAEHNFVGFERQIASDVIDFVFNLNQG